MEAELPLLVCSRPSHILLPLFPSNCSFLLIFIPRNTLCLTLCCHPPPCSSKQPFPAPNQVSDQAQEIPDEIFFSPRMYKDINNPYHYQKLPEQLCKVFLYIQQWQCCYSDGDKWFQQVNKPLTNCELLRCHCLPLRFWVFIDKLSISIFKSAPFTVIQGSSSRMEA